MNRHPDPKPVDHPADLDADLDLDSRQAIHHILVVDDNPAIHDDFRKVLCPAGTPSQALLDATAGLFGHAPAQARPSPYQIDATTRGQDGLALLERAMHAGRPYALAFVDMRMPNGWNGLETARALWQVDPSLQIVLCTAFSDFSWNDIRAELPHSDRFLILKKPFDNIEVQQLAAALTERHRTERTLHAAQEQQRLLETCVAHINDLVMIADASDPAAPPRTVFVNQAYLRKTGYSRAQVLAGTARMLCGPATDLAAVDRLLGAARGGQPGRADLQLYSAGRQAMWLDVDIVPVAGVDGRGLHLVSVMRDITAQKAAQAEVEQLAYYDALTSLPNRRLLIDRLQQLITACARKPSHCGLIFIDLDNFKQVNDTLGHEAGDRLLADVAQRLSGCVREEDTVARLGGDEFVVLLKHLGHDADAAAHHAQRIAAKITQGLAITLPGMGGCSTTASVGITLFGHAPISADELLKNADLAMYRAKTGGKNGHAFFEPGWHVAAHEADYLVRQLRHAAERGQLSLKFQPQFDRSARMVGAEALLRWDCPGRGEVPPAIFLPLALDCGAMARIGDWVLASACRELARWDDGTGLNGLRLAVNVSAAQFMHEDFVDQIAAALARSGARPGALVIELGSGMATHDPAPTGAVIRRLASLGVHVAMDEPCGGAPHTDADADPVADADAVAEAATEAEAACRARLLQLAPTQLKLGRALVRDLPGSPRSVALARGLITRAHALGLQVAAQGIESQAQQRLLLELGCDQFQGYLYARPVVAAELLACAASTRLEIGSLSD